MRRERKRERGPELILNQVYYCPNSPNYAILVMREREREILCNEKIDLNRKNEPREREREWGWRMRMLHKTGSKRSFNGPLAYIANTYIYI